MVKLTVSGEGDMRWSSASILRSIEEPR